MLIEVDQSALMLIDVQEKLLPGIYDKDNFVKNCQWMVELAQLMNVPIIASEQYPEGVGPTTETLRSLVGADEFIGKQFFSCAAAPECAPRIADLNKDTFVLCGMEAQACVLQTAFGLKEMGKRVCVVADAISARSQTDIELSIRRMENAGIEIVSREMVGFEWLRKSSAPQFKDFSMKFLR